MITGFSGSKVQYIKACARSLSYWRPFLEKKTNVRLEKWIKYEHQKEKSRSNSSKYVYSYGYEESPTTYSQLISDLVYLYKAEIVNAIGRGFRVNNVRFWRNLHIPEELQCLDIYSNIFHQDTVCDQCCLQFLINLEDVSEDNGPFEWVSKREHQTAHRAFHNRKAHNPYPARLIVEKLNGPRGTSVLLNTGYHYHRDSVPNKGFERTIMSVALFPEWTKIGSPIRDIIKYED
jgi:hypothetical protein